MVDSYLTYSNLHNSMPYVGKICFVFGKVKYVNFIHFQYILYEVSDIYTVLCYLCKSKGCKDKEHSMALTLMKENFR